MIKFGQSAAVDGALALQMDPRLVGKLGVWVCSRAMMISKAWAELGACLRCIRRRNWNFSKQLQQAWLFGVFSCPQDIK